MVKMFSGGTFLVNGRDIVEDGGEAAERLRGLTGRAVSREEGRQGTIAYSILRDHNTSGSMEKLKLKFDALTSHDITYVGIIQTAKASGLERFPVPYVLTNCHNSLCAVGGTINEDDHLFGLSAAKKYGGIYVPAHMAVIHMYMREAMAGCGKMILGSDSHTRYGALGTMAVGEGGGELVKQTSSARLRFGFSESRGRVPFRKAPPGCRASGCRAGNYQCGVPMRIHKKQRHGVRR